MRKALVELAAMYRDDVTNGRKSASQISTECGISHNDALGVMAMVEFDTDILVSREVCVEDVEDVEADEAPEAAAPETTEFIENDGPDNVSADTQRKMLEGYSNYDNRPLTQAELALKLGWSVGQVNKFFRDRGITHDSLPFTEEDKQQHSPEVLGEKLAEKRDAAIARQAKDASRRRLEKQTIALGNQHENMLAAVTEGLKSAPIVKYQPVKLEAATAPYAVVVGLTDLHFGKYANHVKTDNEFNLDIAAQRVYSRLLDALGNLTRFGAPEKFFLPIGSDFFHIDTYAGTTTRGTRQDVAASTGEIITQGIKVINEIVGLLSSIAPVRLVYVEGNHDQLMGAALMGAMEAGYGDDPNVEVDIKLLHSRSYVTYGDNLIGFTHGDKIKTAQDLASLMATEEAVAWGTHPLHYFYTGHLHFEKTVTDSHRSVTCHQIPSLSGDDDWHAQHGFVGGRKALPLYLHDKRLGQVAVLYSPVVDK